MWLIGVNKWSYSPQEQILQSTFVNLTSKNSDELNTIVDAMENNLGMNYITHIINCHFQHTGFNAVCKYTVNLDFLIIQPNRTKIQIIRQDKKSEGK